MICYTMLYYTTLYYTTLYYTILSHTMLCYAILYYDILSTVLYNVEMTKAVDMWSEVAVFAVTVYEGKVTIGRMYVLASKARHYSLSMRYHLDLFFHTHSSSYNLFTVR